MQLIDISAKINNIVKEYPINRVGVFGSFSRGDFDQNSDIDIVVDLKNHMGYAFFQLWDELETNLQKPVDLLTYSSIMNETKGDLKENFLKEVKWIYET